MNNNQKQNNEEQIDTTIINKTNNIVSTIFRAQNTIKVIVIVLILGFILLINFGWQGIMLLKRASTNTPGPIVVINNVETEITKIDLTKKTDKQTDKIELDFKTNFYSEKNKMGFGSSSHCSFSFKDEEEQNLADLLLESGIFTETSDKNQHNSMSWTIKITYANGEIKTINGSGYTDMFQEFEAAIQTFRSNTLNP